MGPRSARMPKRLDIPESGAKAWIRRKSLCRIWGMVGGIDRPRKRGHQNFVLLRNSRQSGGYTQGLFRYVIPERKAFRYIYFFSLWTRVIYHETIFRLIVCRARCLVSYIIPIIFRYIWITRIYL